MLITMLGTGAPLMPDRATTGLLVTAPGCDPLLIDTCGGFELVRQLTSVGVALASLRNVVVTHRHLDHSGGMQALYLANMPLDVHASADTHDGIRGVTAGCFPEWKKHPDVRQHQVAAGESRVIGGFSVAFFEAQHRVATLAVRVTHAGKTFAFSADTLPCQAIIDCARGADLFLCDAICARADGAAHAAKARDLMHPNAEEAATMALQAGAKALACTHIGRFGTPAKILAEAREVFNASVTIPHDGTKFQL